MNGGPVPIPVFAYDRKGAQRDVNDMLGGQTIDHIEYIGQSGEGFELCAMHLQGGDRVVMTPYPGKEPGTWRIRFAFFPAKDRRLIVVPGARG